MTDATRSRAPAIEGIVPPLVTPLLGRDELDFDGTRRLIERVIAGGVSGLFVLGTTGEAPSLSYRLRREFIQLVCQLVDKRVKVLVGIADTAFVESLLLAQFASEAGADSLVLTTPYYFPAGQKELIHYVKTLLPELQLPLMLYNMPGLTKVWFEIDTLKHLAGLPGIVGVKDSSGDLEYFSRLCELKALRPDWSILIGPEHLLVQALQLGADGGVNGGANIFPALFVDCFTAFRANDQVRVQHCMHQIEALQEIYTVGKYASRFIKATKSALSIKGICEDHLAEPFNHFLHPERQRVSEILSKLEIFE